MTTPSDKLDEAQIAEWRKRIKDKIFSDFCDEPNEAHGTNLQAQFDALCDMALTATTNAAPQKGEVPGADPANKSAAAAPYGPTEEEVRIAHSFLLADYSMDAQADVLASAVLRWKEQMK